MKKNLLKYLIYATSILSIILVWFFWSVATDNVLIAPSPFKTFKSMFVILSNLTTYKIILHTLFRLVFSIILSFILALIFGGIAWKFQYFKTFMHPIVTSLRTIPIASIIVIILIILGSSKTPYILTCLMVFPVCYEAIVGGLSEVSKNECMDVYKLDSNLNLLVLIKVYFPFVKPFLKISLIQSLGLGLKVLVMSEFISQTKLSIGREIYNAKNNLELDNVLSWTIILVFLVILLELLLDLFKNEKKEKKYEINDCLSEINEEQINENINILIK